MTDEDTQFGADLLEAMAEVAAWKRGEITLAVREIEPMPPDRSRAMRRADAGSGCDVHRPAVEEAVSLQSE